MHRLVSLLSKLKVTGFSVQVQSCVGGCFNVVLNKTGKVKCVREISLSSRHC
ncbi:MAG: hypothetical protein ACKERG_03360 [Candidatus Hodgkinia cicadicola]